MATPIWKDTYARYGVSEALVRVRLDDPAGQVIHVGRVYRKPSVGSVELRLNDIVRPYLFELWPSIPGGSYYDASASLERTVYVTFSNPTTGADYATQSYSFQYDWSYDIINAAGSNRPQKSWPIINRISRNQPILWTTLAVSNLRAELYYDGTYGTEMDFAAAAQNNGTASMKIDGFSSIFDELRIVGNNTRYDFQIVDGCYRYALYYVNAYGGWDTLLIEGKGIKTDTYARKTAKKTYDNSVTFNAGDLVYKNEITRSWELHTGWLTDEEAGRMHHLLGSTLAMLYDMETLDFIPVTIQNSDCIYKEFATNGHRMASYTILVNEARDITRR